MKYEIMQQIGNRINYIMSVLVQRLIIKNDRLLESNLIFSTIASKIFEAMPILIILRSRVPEKILCFQTNFLGRGYLPPPPNIIL